LHVNGRRTSAAGMCGATSAHCASVRSEGKHLVRMIASA
jgi:hypothetical protein